MQSVIKLVFTPVLPSKPDIYLPHRRNNGGHCLCRAAISTQLTTAEGTLLVHLKAEQESCWHPRSSVIFVNEKENENCQKRKITN